MDIRIERYRPELEAHWHELLACARNGLFLFERPYMDYHGDRFMDMSFMAFAGDEPIAVFPAALEPTGRLVSHPGLTFGGLVLAKKLRSQDAFIVLDAILDAARKEGAVRCLVKMLPEAFASYPSGEIAYGLWRRGFKLVRRDLSSLLPISAAIPLNSSKLLGVKRARKSGVAVHAKSASEFHELLDDVLHERHGVAAVHSRAELAMLQSRFPDNIVCRVAQREGQQLAGSVVFKYGHVWHTQYLASSEEGRKCGALDLVISELIDEAKAGGVKYLSFGASTVSEGRHLNEGLLWQKESFGARAIVHDFYEGDL